MLPPGHIFAEIEWDVVQSTWQISAIYTWLLRGLSKLLWDLCGCYGVYVAFTGTKCAVYDWSNVCKMLDGTVCWLLRDLKWLLRDVMWLLRDLEFDCYLECIKVRKCHRDLSGWIRDVCGMLRDLSGCYGMYVAATGSKWLLRDECGC